jgi:hypothetical protein
MSGTHGSEGAGAAAMRPGYPTLRAWRAGGFAALAPPARQVTPRTDAAVLELAAGLKREKPARTAAQVMRILRASCGWSPSVRTLQRHFERLELTTRPDGLPPQAFGRFEASRPNELWTGDALHGPHIAGRKAYLFAFLDDHSRAVMAARWGYFEDSVRLAAALRPALAARGVPDAIYAEYVPRHIFHVLCPAALCDRQRAVPGDRGSGLRRRPHNDQSVASQLSRDSSVCQIGLARCPAEAPGGSTARSASCLALVLISA